METKKRENDLTSGISFCNKIVQNLLCEDIKKSILDKLSADYQIQIKQKDYVVLRKNFLNNLKINDHIISTKTFGNPYYLYLTKYNNVNTCFYIDRKVKEGYNLPRILISKHRFSDELFCDTLLEVELIRTKKKNWLFLISNLFVYKGELIKSNFVNRLNIIYNLLTNEYTPDPYLDVCPFEVKKVFTYNQFHELLENFIPNLEYPIKGLIFFPINKKYNDLLYLFPREKTKIVDKNTKIIPKEKFKINTGINFVEDNNTKKKDNIKDIIQQINESITIENNDEIILRFKISSTETPDIFNLYILNDKKYLFYGLAHIQTLKVSRFIKKIFKNHDDNTKDIIVNCKYCLKFKKWEPISISENKKADTIKYLKEKLNL